MEDLKTIIKNTVAKVTYICNGKVYFQIDTAKHSYQLEINSLDSDWKSVYIQPEYKSITLMRWFRKGIDKKDDTLILLK